MRKSKEVGTYATKKGNVLQKGKVGNRGIKDHDVGREWVMRKYES